ncbi:MAG TPA: hypothetical protein VKO16_06925, partial [Polyangia bacterium]|nr:hypothetical protein [Polyangia bacterium]
MSRGDKRWIITGSLVALTGLGIFALRHRSQSRRLAAHEEAAAARFRGLASGPLGPSGSSNGAETRSPDELKRDVDGDMSRWRTAVVVKDAETVVALDLTFR